MSSVKHISVADYSLLLLVTLIWGGNFTLIKIGLEQIQPFVMTFIRFFLCAIPFVFFMPKPKISTHILVAYGILFGGGVWGSANIAIQAGTSPGTVSLLIQLSTFITFAIGLIVFKEKTSRTSMLALSISLSGLFFMLHINGDNSGLVGIFTSLFAAFCFSLCTFIIQKHKPQNLLPFMVWSFLFSLPLLFFLALYFDGAESFYTLKDAMNFKSIASLASQSYATTLLGYWAWNYCVKKYTGSAVAPIGLLVPFFAIIISYVFLDHPITLSTTISIILVFLGVMMLNLRHKIANGSKTP